MNLLRHELWFGVKNTPRDTRNYQTEPSTPSYPRRTSWTWAFRSFDKFIPLLSALKHRKRTYLNFYHIQSLTGFLDSSSYKFWQVYNVIKRSKRPKITNLTFNLHSIFKPNLLPHPILVVLPGLQVVEVLKSLKRYLALWSTGNKQTYPSTPPHPILVGLEFLEVWTSLQRY